MGPQNIPECEVKDIIFSIAVTLKSRAQVSPKATNDYSLMNE
jgi:hypothetical protein